MSAISERVEGNKVRLNLLSDSQERSQRPLGDILRRGPEEIPCCIGINSVIDVCIFEHVPGL